MAEYADLEIGLHRRDAGTYTIDFRFSQPNSEADVRLGQGQVPRGKRVGQPLIHRVTR